MNLTALGDVLQALGIAYWVFTTIAMAMVLIKARGWVWKSIDAIALLCVLVLSPALSAIDQVAQQKAVQRRLSEAMAIFNKHCETAGMTALEVHAWAA